METNFWETSTGAKADGSAEASHTKTRVLIPNNTFARGRVIKIVLNQQHDPWQFEITYNLTDGDFKGQEISQKIKCFGIPSPKRDRAVNMLVRLCKLTNVVLKGTEPPTVADLMPMLSKVIGLKIQEYYIAPELDKPAYEGNWIPEIHKADESFKSQTGVKMVHQVKQDAPPPFMDFQDTKSTERDYLPFD